MTGGACESTGTFRDAADEVDDDMIRPLLAALTLRKRMGKAGQVSAFRVAFPIPATIVRSACVTRRTSFVAPWMKWFRSFRQSPTCAADREELVHRKPMPH
jgi:hypothetical protein